MGKIADTNKKVMDVVVSFIKDAVSKGNTLPWQKPWTTQRPHNYDSKHVYRGINLLLTMIISINRNWDIPAFLTWNQVKKLGGNVLKNEAKNWIPIVKVTRLYFYDEKRISEKEYKALSPDERKNANIATSLKYYRVYNVAQTDINVVVEKREHKTLAECENLIQKYASTNCPINIQYSDRAFYSPNQDKIVLPNREQFDAIEKFYSTAFHEMIHSTGHKDRLNRDGVTNFDKFGSHQYAEEELIAEIGASILNAEFGIFDSTKDNSAAYVQGWIKRISENPDILIDASREAEKASEYILSV